MKTKSNEEIEKSIERICCTMRLEGMNLSEEEKESLRQLLKGETNYEDHIKAIIENANRLGGEYRHSEK